jgi:hypothetical protein
LIDGFSWWLVLAYLLLVACVSTYWDWLFKYDNFWFSGLMCGLAGIPLLFCGYPLWAILTRAALISVSWWLITSLSDNDFFEEYGRGFSLSFASIVFLLPI